jgi:hypothetical protein
MQFKSKMQASASVLYGLPWGIASIATKQKSRAAILGIFTKT